jgi:hypothetical protein
MNLSTPEEKAAIGITEVAEQSRPDDRYYWVTGNGDGTYTATPKDLFTLQANMVNQINTAAFSVLQPTDYIDTRNLREPSYKPEWMVWRASVLTAARAGVAAVTACTTVEELAALPSVAWPPNPDHAVSL